MEANVGIQGDSHTYTFTMFGSRGEERIERLSMFSLRGIGEKVREINYFPLVGYIHLHLGPHFSLLLVLFLLFSILSNQMN